jgi:hypothetical protein
MSDIKVTLRDKEFALVPTFEAIEHVEAAIGRSVFAVFHDVGTGVPLKVGEIVSIVAYSAKTFGTLPDWWSRNAVGEEVIRQGVAEFYRPIAQWLKAICLAAPETKLPADKSEGDSEKKA